MNAVVNEGGAAGAGAGGDGSGGGAAAGAANQAWYGELPADRPAEFREWVTNKGYKDPLAALESNYNLERLVGFDKAGRTIVKPKDDNDAEGRASYLKAIGVPEKPEEYALPVPEGDDGAFAKTAAAWMHEAGVPKAAAVKVAENWNKFITEAVKAQEVEEQRESAAQLETLKGEWGAKFDENTELARRGFSQVLGNERMQKLEKALGTAEFLRMAYDVGTKISGDRFVAGGDKSGNGFGMSIQEARTKLDAIRLDRASGKITDLQWREGMEAEFERLSKIVTPGT